MRIIKQVVEIGNGAAVYVPREYSGREVIVILPEGINELKKRILTSLIDYMDNILGVYLYGSYARGEQGKNSDVDILVITHEKDEDIKNILKEFDARIVSIEEIKKAINETPLLIMPILLEAKPLINPLLLEELKSHKINFKKFKWHFDDIRRTIGIIEEFIELDDKDIASSHIYSLVMRIRGCYLIECLLKNKKFNNEGVISVLLNYGLDKREINLFFDIYRKIRDDENERNKIDKDKILKLINILKEYSKEVEDETKKEIEKRN